MNNPTPEQPQFPMSSLLLFKSSTKSQAGALMCCCSTHLAPRCEPWPYREGARGKELGTSSSASPLPPVMSPASDVVRGSPSTARDRGTQGWRRAAQLQGREQKDKVSRKKERKREKEFIILQIPKHHNRPGDAGSHQVLCRAAGLTTATTARTCANCQV